MLYHNKCHWKPDFLISGIFHLVFSDFSWLVGTEISESKTIKRLFDRHCSVVKRQIYHSNKKHAGTPKHVVLSVWNSPSASACSLIPSSHATFSRKHTFCLTPSIFPFVMLWRHVLLFFTRTNGTRQESSVWKVLTSPLSHSLGS